MKYCQTWRNWIFSNFFLSLDCFPTRFEILLNGFSSEWDVLSFVRSFVRCWWWRHHNYNWSSVILVWKMLYTGACANVVLLSFFFFLNNNFCVKPYVPREPEGTQVIVGSMNMGYISDTTRNQTHNLFHPKREPIPLCHSAGHLSLARVRW